MNVCKSWRFIVASSLTVALSASAVCAWYGFIMPQTTTTTTTITTTTVTTSSTFTTTRTTTTITTTSVPLLSKFDPIHGGQSTKTAASNWLHLWRGAYVANKDMVPDLDDASLPKVFQGIKPKVVISSGGVASGVVTEGMGYALMIEGIHAAAGDKAAIHHALSLMRGWLGMVHGPSTMTHPFGGGTNETSSSTDVKVWPYGVSAIKGHNGLSGSGVAAWKYPLKLCQDMKPPSPFCTGTATDGDQDAVFGMVYLAAALNYPEDFVDMTMRAVISFASADLGFPDLYRTLPDGKRMFVPKGGSDWGGLLPPGGKWASSQDAWCYSPGYFSPGTYRVFRDFVVNHWKPSFDEFLPPHLDGTSSSMSDLFDAYNGAVTAGYNILYYASCESGAVSNWAGVKTPCEHNDTLSCPGVPWATTPYVGKNGTCSQSGTKFGSYGPDASRTPWRIAMDYVLYTNEAIDVTLYDRGGEVAKDATFNAKTYLNRISTQYKQYSKCNGSVPGECLGNPQHSAWQLAFAFDVEKGHLKHKHLVCDNVPNDPETWWSDFMAWPTFSAFVAPSDELTREQSATWLDTFTDICVFNKSKPKGNLCATTYFEASQEVITIMLMSGGLSRLPSFKHSSNDTAPEQPRIQSVAHKEAVQIRLLDKADDKTAEVVRDNDEEVPTRLGQPRVAGAFALAALVGALCMVTEGVYQMFSGRKEYTSMSGAESVLVEEEGDRSQMFDRKPLATP